MNLLTVRRASLRSGEVAVHTTRREARVMAV